MTLVCHILLWFNVAAAPIHLGALGEGQDSQWLPRHSGQGGWPTPVRPLKGSRFRNKQAISLTDAAAARVKELLEQRADRPIGIRIGVVKRGCNGMSYTMNYEYAGNGTGQGRVTAATRPPPMEEAVLSEKLSGCGGGGSSLR